MQTRFSFGLGNHQTRKLSLNKETLRQLTDGELRQVAGGNTSMVPSTVSVSISTRTSVSSGTSIISPSTSVPVSH